MSLYLHSPIQIANQLKEQLSSDKRKLGFFFGAGTSMAVGIPGVFALTKQISELLVEPYKAQFNKLRDVVNTGNIEHILNKLRTIRELIDPSEEEEIYTIKGKTAAQKLDVAICKAISNIVDNAKVNEIVPHYNFSNWLFQNQSTRHNPIEIFTTNYDLLIEQSLEYKKLPYFDGFVGTILPFLIPECVEAENNKNDQGIYIPYSWIRLWKIHGSVNWYLTTDKDNKKRIVRSSNKELSIGDELMIYPSKQKYDESRRLPFLTFQDRLRKFLSTGETLLVVAGYSFGDDHLNEILFQALRANNRLAITALMYGESQENSLQRKVDEKILKFGQDNPNFTIIGPDKACVGGVVTEWDKQVPGLEKTNYWDSVKENINLGDFSVFTEYLKMNFGIIAQLQEKPEESQQNAK